MEREADPLRLSPRAIYFLLSFAWGFYDPRDELLVGTEAIESPADMLFLALSMAASRIIRRGPDREYAELRSVGPEVRGRLEAGATMRMDRGMSRLAVSTYIVMKADCPQNNAIKTALCMAARMSRLARGTRERASLVAHAFPGEALRSRKEAIACIRSARIHRNNSHYRIALMLAKLILEATRPGNGGFRFINPFDRARLNAVFEEFLRAFFVRELAGQAKVQSERLRWEEETGVSSKLLPLMKTDITIRAPARCMVIDAKYYADPFIEHHGKMIFRPAHLFQMAAYGSVSRQTDPLRRPWTGALVYAQNGVEFRHSCDLRGFKLSVVGLDLEAAPSLILEKTRAIWTRGL